MRLVILVTVLGLAVCPLSVAQGAPDSSRLSGQVAETPQRLEAELSEIERMARNDETVGLLDKVRAVVASPAFDRLNDDQRYFALSMLGSALYDAHDAGAANPVLVRASEMAQASGHIWLLRLYTTDDSDKAMNLLCLVTIAERWPTAMGEVSKTYIAGLIRQSEGSAELKEMRFRLMQALRAANWPDDDATFTPDGVWLSLVREDLDRGSVHAAAAVAEAITDPLVLIELRIDRRYDQVRGELGDHLDIARAQGAELSRLRSYVAAHPDRLDALNALIMELIDQNRPVEALELIDNALAKAKLKPRVYADADDNLIWILNDRTTALQMLGRTDEALDAMTRAARLPENGAENVSQVINLGGYYDDLGRPRDALAAVADVENGHISDYGMMQARSVRACSYAQLHDRTHYEAELKAMQSHLSDAPSAVEMVLLCADDLDAASNLLIKRLADPLMRTGALSDSQIYLRPDHQPAYAALIEQRRRVILARPDVKAAIDLVGRVESEPRLPPDY